MATAILPESATAAGRKISIFFHSLFLLLLNALQRALDSFSNSSRFNQNRTHPHPHQHQHQHQHRTASIETSNLEKMAPHVPANKSAPVKIVPALPLLPLRSARKENQRPLDQLGLTKPDTDPAATRRVVNIALPILPPPASYPTDRQRENITPAFLGSNGKGPGPISSRPTDRTFVGAALPVLPVLPPLSNPTSSPPSEPLTGEHASHASFMREALDMARLALQTNETPVGCVLVHQGRIIAKGMNATNVTRNGTRHAELMAISALLSVSAADTEAKTADHAQRAPLAIRANAKKASVTAVPSKSWGDVDPKDGHLYPYGQKLHPSPRVNASVISECILYVTVEPCVMCASLLRQLGIRKVYFGAVNDKFGGTGGVFRIHINSGSARTVVSAPPSPQLPTANQMFRPYMERRPMSYACPSGAHDSAGGGQDISNDARSVLEGHGGNIERGFDVEGGWGRDEAVTLLRQFYVQENGRAPVPRKKEGRAARLAAMMERDGHCGGPMIEVLPATTGSEPSSPCSSTSPEVAA